MQEQNDELDLKLNSYVADQYSKSAQKMLKPVVIDLESVSKQDVEIEI